MDAPAIDARRVSDVMAAIGADRYGVLLDRLLSTLADDVADVASLHRLAGSAGALGLARLAAALAAAEQALAGNIRPDLAPIRRMAATDAAMARPTVENRR